MAASFLKGRITTKSKIRFLDVPNALLICQINTEDSYKRFLHHTMRKNMDPCSIMSNVDCIPPTFWQHLIKFYYVYEWETRILLSTLVGAVIGFERELRGKAAGIRTYAIVAMGSCLFTILSCFAPGTHDTTRIAAQVVSGIGFLGVGVIWHKDGGMIEGLTTAASLWGVAAIGMGIGYGAISIALTSAFMVLIIMELFGLAVKTAKKVFNVKPEK